MPHKAADRIRNVALIGHRGGGKTSLHEALLFEAGVVNRLGRVEDGSTTSDYEPDEQEREMSIGATVSSFDHDGRKINLIDTPGDPSFIADTVASLRVADAAVVAQGEGRGAPKPQDIPEELVGQAQEYREKLMDEVAENSDELMERYLEGEEIDHDEIVTVLKRGVTDGRIFPVACGVATKNLGTTRLLEALVEDLPSPAMRGPVTAIDGDGEEIEIAPEEDG